MPGALQNKVAIVTGASEGIGRAVAARFAAAGARLVLNDTNDAAESVAAEITANHPHSGATAVVADLTDPDAVDHLVRTTLDHHGRLDILAHATAAAQRAVPATELSLQEWERILAVNVTGPFLLCQRAIPVLTSPGGSIVFTGSITGEQGQAGQAAYSTSKGALRLFTQSLALDVAHRGLRVNGVAPAFVESEMGETVVAQIAAARDVSVEHVRAERDARIPWGRQGTTEEIADAFVYLASDAASYVTGTWLDVNGGAGLR